MNGGKMKLVADPGRQEMLLMREKKSSRQIYKQCTVLFGRFVFIERFFIFIFRI